VSEAVGTIETVYTPDAFVDNEKLAKCFQDVADYISLWHWLYGLAYSDVRAGRIEWLTHNTLGLRISNRLDNTPISPGRYDPRLPNLDVAWRQRLHRMRQFIRMSPWYRRRVLEFEHHISDWKAERRLTNADLDVTTRWQANGLLFIKLIDKRLPATADTHMTHKRD
jgi:hypothetical protein